MAANSSSAAAGGGLRRCHWDGAGQEGTTCRVSYTCLSLSWFGIDGDDERIYFSKIRNRGSDPDGGAGGQRDWIFRCGDDFGDGAEKNPRADDGGYSLGVGLSGTGERR